MPDTFTPYGATHRTVLAVIVIGAVLLVLLGRRIRDTHAGAVFSRGFAVVLIGWALAMQVHRMLPGNWDVASSLPLHFSDLTWMTAAYTLWTQRRWSFALTYYWGLTLNPQAMLTPALDAPDFPDLAFIDFWVLHTLAVWAAVFLTWGLGMRPDWRSVATAVTATVAWGLGLLGFNALAGTNYGFVHRRAGEPVPARPAGRLALVPGRRARPRHHRVGPDHVAVDEARKSGGHRVPASLPWRRPRFDRREVNP